MAFLSRVQRTQSKEKAEKNAQLEREAAASRAAAAKANSPLEIVKQTVLGIPKATVDVGKDIAKGAVEFAVSAGEAPVRLASPKRSAVVLPPTKIPGLGALGPVQSYQSKAAQAVQDGASVPEAVAKGTLDTFINDPVGIAFKPAIVATGFLARVAAQRRAAAGIDGNIITDIFRRGKKAVVEEPAAPGPRRDAEFEGMTLDQRLAATGERNLPVFSDQTLRPIPVEGRSQATPIPFANDYRQTQPDIPLGTVPRGTKEPVAGQTPAGGKAPPGYRYEPVVEPRQLSPVAAPAAKAPVVEPTAVPAPKAPPAPILEPTGPVQTTPEVRPPTVRQPDAPTKTSGLARGVETSAVEKKLTDGFQGLSEYETINIKDQAGRASDILARDYDKAKRIALGLEEAPAGTKNFAVYTAVEQRAIKEGDIDTLRDLATKSRLNEESSGAAQTLRLLAERDPESPVAAIADIAKTRANVAAKRGVKPTEVKTQVKQAKDAIAKAPKEDWNSFVDSITC